MAYTIRYFQPNQDKKNPLSVKSSVLVVNTAQSVLLINEIEDSYIPTVWSSVISQRFASQPTLLSRKDWYDLSELQYLTSYFLKEAKTFYDALSSEQKFVADSIRQKHYKSGISFASLAMQGDRIKYSLLGDSFLFVYDKHTKTIVAYCSMLDCNGHLDITQPCHSLYNDLTTIGKPITGEKTLSDSYVFLMTRDLSNWFVNNISQKAIESLLKINDSQDFESFVNKTYSKQKYSGNPFNKETASLVIIEYVENNYLKRLLKCVKAHLNRKKVFYVLALSVLLAILATLLLFKSCTQGTVIEPSTDVDQIEKIINNKINK